jgi:hypothetical protein
MGLDSPMVDNDVLLTLAATAFALGMAKYALIRFHDHRADPRHDADTP